jgi:hypothetical protein
MYMVYVPSVDIAPPGLILTFWLPDIKQYSLPHLLKVTGVASLKTFVVAIDLPNSHIRYKPPVDWI